MINQIEHEATVDPERLLFRRQFLLTETPINQLEDWSCLEIDRYYLYAHPDLEVNQISDSEKSIVLIGELYDSDSPEKGNVDILRDILINAHGKEALIAGLKRYAGCYALLYTSGGEGVIVHDARALREIYYCKDSNQIVCGSQPNLVAKFSSPEVELSSNPMLLDFYKNHLDDSKWIGDETYFQGIKYLTPDHYLDINKREVHRYWPHEPIKRLDLKEAVPRACAFLQGIMRAIVHRHSAMMAVTAGTDSRTLLAASRGIRDKIYYFVNNIGLHNDHPDISIPIEMFAKIGTPFHVHDVPQDVSDEFRKIFLNNTFIASDRYLPAIYHVLFKNHADKVLILGVGEIGRTYYGKEPKQLNSYLMAYKLGYPRAPYVINQCGKLLPEVLRIAKKYGINAMDFLHWEYRLGPWGAVRNSESNIAIEKVDPYNSHLLSEIFLGVDDKHKNHLEHPCVLFREMIRNMWPQLLDWPINPVKYSLRGKLVKRLPGIGVYHSLKNELRYQSNYLRYLYEARRH